VTDLASCYHRSLLMSRAKSWGARRGRTHAASENQNTRRAGAPGGLSSGICGRCVEKGQEYYGKSAVTVTAVHSELLVGASGLGNNEPGGRLVLCGRLPPPLSTSRADETALARRRLRVNKEKGTGGSACGLHAVTAGALLPLRRASRL
jgi:hypothetical protein